MFSIVFPPRFFLLGLLGFLARSRRDTFGFQRVLFIYIVLLQVLPSLDLIPKGIKPNRWKWNDDDNDAPPLVVEGLRRGGVNEVLEGI